jgi:hypothetical protein
VLDKVLDVLIGVAKILVMDALDVFLPLQQVTGVLMGTVPNSTALEDVAGEVTAKFPAVAQCGAMQVDSMRIAHMSTEGA